MNVTQILTISIALFPIIDILGNLPIIISLQKKVGDIYPEKAAIAAGFLMITFLFVGNAILDFMEIPIQAFAVAGSLILFILAIEMILGVSFHKTEIPKSATIVPVAFPLLAGPGVLTTILSMRTLYQIENIIGAIVVNILIVYIAMKGSKYIAKALGDTGIVIIHKISGVVLLALAIKLFADNWESLFVTVKSISH